VNTASVFFFHGIEFEALLILLGKEGICASSASACHSDFDESSQVIKTMRSDKIESHQALNQTVTGSVEQ
jgi:cysteine sulfinate desulfinase/cysteine desulfurase-like protein